jgi:hypothetical protein
LRPLALLVLFAGAAEARRAGVPAADLTPPGATLTSVTAPLAPGLPARLVYGDALFIDVVVAADEAGAEAGLARMLRGYAREPGPKTASVVVDNIAVLVRCLNERCDAQAHAERVRAAIARAPVGSPTAARPRVREGEITLPAWMLAGRVVVRGPGVVRKSGERRFHVSRTGSGALEIEVVGIDDRLRPTR